MVFVVAGVVILLDEAEVLLPLPLQSTFPPLCVGREVALQGAQSVKQSALSGSNRFAVREWRGDRGRVRKAEDREEAKGGERMAKEGRGRRG